MIRAHKSVNGTQSDTMAEVVSAKPHRIVRGRAPPDYVEKVSRYLESSVEQGTQDEVAHEQAAADSDSGDSLFITQKTVPAALRSARRPRKPRSAPKSPREIEGSGSDTSSSSPSSQRKPKSHKVRRRKNFRLPKYSFPFVSEWKLKARGTLLPVKQNIDLHNYAMGGFFNCVKELWQRQCGEVVQSSLPTIEMEKEYIYPLSENEDERSDNDDIKIVERKQFVVPLKAKSQQNWCNQSKQQSKRKQKTAPNNPAEASVSRATPAAKQQGNNECVTSDKQFLFQTESPNTKGCTRVRNRGHIQQEAMEDELRTDSDATICESLEPQRSPRQYTQKDRRASATAAKPETDVLHTADLTQAGQSRDEPDSQSLLHSLPDSENVTNNDRECAKTRVKRGQKKEKDKVLNETVEEERSQSQQEPEGLHAASSVTAEVAGTPTLSQDNEEEPPASQTNDELGSNEINCMEDSSHGDPMVRQEERDIRDSKQKKKKRKKEKSKAENVRQEEGGNVELDERMEDSAFSVGCNLENGGTEKEKKTKKKKKKKMSEDAEQIQSSAVAEPLIDDAEPKKKKKKKERVITEECEEQDTSTKTLFDLPLLSAGPLEESVCSENTASSFESGYVKRKGHKKKEKPSSVGTAHHGEEGVDVSFSNDATALEGHTEVELKKKKKNKKKTPSEEVNISHTPEENAKVEDVDNNQVTNKGIEDQNAELGTKKKKKKKKKAASEEMDISDTPEENGKVQKDIDNQQKTNKGLEDQNVELVTKKKKKKKITTEEVDVSYTPEENGKVEDVNNNQATNEGLEDQYAEPVIKKKKKKTTSEEMSISYTPEKNKKVEDIDNHQKTNKGLEDLNAELVTKKKKKKKKHEPSSGNISEDNVAHSDNSASVRKKEKKRTSSFLIADAEETDAQTHKEQNSSSQSADIRVWGTEKIAVTTSDFQTGSAEIAGNMEECDDGLRKKKIESKMSGEPDGVEVDHKQGFKEPNTTCESALLDTSDTEVKRKKRHKGNESELVTLTEKLESAADAGHPPTDEVVPLKKKKKKKRKDDRCHEMQESPPAATEMIESQKLSVHTSGPVSPTFPLAAKGKHGGSAEISHDDHTSDNASNETLHMPEQAAPRKKKKIKSTDNVAKSLTKSAELERNMRSDQYHTNITSSMPMLSETPSSEMSSLDRLMKKKHRKVKQALYKPSMNFFTD